MTPESTLAPPARSNGLLQFILFGLIGASGVIVDFAVVFICREWFGLDVRIGIFPAFIFAVTWNYELNRRITFKREGKHIPWLRSYMSFVLICLAGLLVRWLATHTSIEYAGLRGDRFLSMSLALLDQAGQNTPDAFQSFGLTLPAIRLSYVAYVLGIGVASLFNFFGSKWFAFATPKDTTQK